MFVDGRTLQSAVGDATLYATGRFTYRDLLSSSNALWSFLVLQKDGFRRFLVISA